tara:strand:- start:437 stop:850 length:414 start_codon:yes stop_codon:yes gene_type:complete
MKRFLILILFSLLFSIQSSFAVSPSLDETMEFLVNGDVNKNTWYMNDCNVIILPPPGDLYKKKEEIDLNKVNLNSFEALRVGGKESGFEAKCIGLCRTYGNEKKNSWVLINEVNWERNSKALSHLYSNFCTGVKSAF